MSLRSDKIIKWSSEVDPYEILHSLPDAVFTTDRQMRINYFNLAASTITGFRSQEALGMYCKDVLKSNTCETECHIKKALDSHENIFNIESVITTATGKQITILISATLLADSSGNVVGYMHVFRDVSPIKKIMSDLEISHNNLAERNVELDNTLKELKSTQKQLLHAQKMESMGILAGGIAHDFNNLLSGILGYASLLKIKIGPDHLAYKYADTIEQSAVKASRLTQQLLTFSRGGEYQAQAINLNRIIEETLHILERTISKKIQIVKSLASDLWRVEADPSQIEQVLMNLSINAHDAMPTGGKLTVTTENFHLNNGSNTGYVEAAPGNYVKMSISDTGEGIPEGIQNKIFDPFFSTKGKEKGTGLGLAVVYGVVKNHGGYISVESDPDRGTIFEILFPMFDKLEETTDIVSELKVKGGRETILLVDDEEMLRSLGQEILLQKEYTVLLASNGIEAIQLYKKQEGNIDLVVLDMIMPKMDGLETYKRLKEMNPSLKILITSGYSEDTQNHKKFRNGIEGFIQKPYKINTLIKKVREILDMNR
ncbi:MAG: response regulator [Deltaproteobacteria bacterium]|nr:response regulator [Deltaproteobacteria bacterium]